jgi:hypothetical protein
MKLIKSIIIKIILTIVVIAITCWGIWSFFFDGYEFSLFYIPMLIIYSLGFDILLYLWVDGIIFCMKEDSYISK